MGIFVSSGLLRFGPSFENTAWSSLFLLAPLGCIYYPIEILPEFFQNIAKGLPLVYIFEEARSILVNQVVNYSNIIKCIYFKFNLFNYWNILFYYSFSQARKKGTLLINIDFRIIWCARKESNPEPPEPKSGALSS